MNQRLVYSRDEKEQSTNNNIPFINYRDSAPKRCLRMLLSKFKGEDYNTEVNMAPSQMRSKPSLSVPLNQANILLLTDGGIVPRGNPDQIPPTNADRFGVYYLSNIRSLDADSYEISHQGYDHGLVDENPNRLLPVDVLSELAREGVIGSLCPFFISTTGVMIASENARLMGEKVAKFIENKSVHAVIIISTCATSTRTGSYLGVAIENSGIPVVQIANLTAIPRSIGVSRTVEAASVECPMGCVDLCSKTELEYRKKLVISALDTLKS